MSSGWHGRVPFNGVGGVFPEVNETLRDSRWPVSGKPTGEFTPELNIVPGPQQTVRIKMNKDTHRLRYDAESEHEVSITLEPKEAADQDT